MKRIGVASSQWETYPLQDVFATGSNTLPTNVCPVTSIRVCDDNQCSNEQLEADGFRITGE